MPIACLVYLDSAMIEKTVICIGLIHAGISGLVKIFTESSGCIFYVFIRKQAADYSGHIGTI